MLIHNAAITGSLTYNGIDIGDITGSEVSIGALNSFSSSINIYTGSNNTNINALQTFSSSILTYTASNDSINTTQNNRLSSLETTSGSLINASSSFSTRVTSLESFSSSLDSTFATDAELTSLSSSVTGRLTTDESNISSLQTASGSFSTRTTNLETASGSFSTRVTSNESNITSLNSKTGSYATTGSNTFVNTQYISAANNPVSFTSTASLYTDGGVRVAKDLYVSGTSYFNNVTIFGTQSVQYITSSQLNIGTNIITVNTDTPTIRFGGLAVYDSGSTGLTGSMLWDSEDNQWIYSNPSGSAFDSAVFLVGPRNSGTLGSEVGITTNALAKGDGAHHMTSSGIFESGSNRNVGIGTSIPAYKLDVVGAIQSSVASGNGSMYFNNSSLSSKFWTAIPVTNGSETDLQWYYGGTGAGTKVTFANNGNVGIGTTSPTREMVLYRSSGEVHFKLANGTTGESITDGFDMAIDSSGGAYLINRENQPMHFFTSGSERMRITSDGNVGIGTTSPVTYGTRNLDVNAGSGGAAYIVARANSNAGTVELAFDTDAGYLSTKSNHPLVFRTNDTERMRISGSFVGIGTTSPKRALHISGIDGNAEFELTNTAMASGARNFNIWGNTSDGTWNIRTLVDNSGAQSVNFVSFLASTGAATFNSSITTTNLLTTSMSGGAINIRGDESLNSNFGIIWTTPTYTGGIAAIRVARRGASDASDMMFFTAPNGDIPNERMRITSGGNVGIGTTSSDTKLRVEGTGRFTGTLNADSNITFSGYIKPSSNVGYGVKSADGTVLQEWYNGSTYHYGLFVNSDRIQITSNGGTNPVLAIRQTNASNQGYDFETEDVSVGRLDLYGVTSSGRVQAMTWIKASGNVGIGTISPGYKLDVVGATRVSGNTYFSNTLFSTSGGQVGINNSSPASGFSLDVRVGGNTHAAYFGGNVGIGTTSPSTKLHVVGTSTFTDEAYFTDKLGVGTVSLTYKAEVAGAIGEYWNGSAFTGTPLALAISNTTAGGYDPVLLYRQADSGGTTKLAGGIGIVGTGPWTAGNNSTQTSDMYFLVRNDSGGISERMRIKSNGNVGVGTSSPAYKFQSNGPSGDWSGYFKGSSTSNNSYGLFIDAGTTSADSPFMVRSADGGTVFLRILGNGNVGIGTTSPSYKLDVNGVAAFGTTTKTEIGNASDTPSGAGVNYGIFHNSGVGLGIASGAGGSTQGIAFWSNNGSSFFRSMMIAGGSGNVGIGTENPGCSLDIGSKTDALRLPNGTTAQRPSSPTAGMGRFNTSTTRTEFYNGTVWVNVGGSGDGSTSSSPATSAKAIKQIVGNPTSGVYWLQIPNVNSGNAFQCYCDFTMDGGVGYAIIFNQYFTGAETGPSHANFASSTISTAGWDTEYQISPTAMVSNYGVTKLAVFARTGGSAAGGITGASYFNWVAFTGPTTTQFNNIFTNSYASNQFTGTFNSSDGNTGTAYFPNSHGNSGGVTQVSTNGGTVNDYILYEYNAKGGSDPNHFWMVANGRVGDVYWVVNNRYGSSTGNVMYNRWGGVALY
jgi:hypothetical protein